MKLFRSLLAVLFLLSLSVALFAQSTNASLTGFVEDASKAVIPGVRITAINTQTGVTFSATTNSGGLYVLPNLDPGTYRIEVDKQGFKGVVEPGVVLHVQQILQVNFQMAVGSMSETVTVRGNDLEINTTDASVSTVVDRNYIANMPLNGRSLQSLLLLTPGVANTSPQTGALTGYSGEFSVNGQRTDANNYDIDGVSANTGSYRYAYGTTGTAGALPAASALGTTQNLVSLDALEEFRVESSSYSAEYGRTPGGQLTFLTRSGTNEWHGTGFDYLRNGVFDANNWFNDYFGVPNPGERQNDFGGTLGGPITIPHLYDGKDKSFFFFSYEGVRLGQPVSATVSYVPDTAMRQGAPAALQPVLNVFPIQNGPEAGNGLAEFVGSGTTPSILDSTSTRLDHTFSPMLKVFFRFANTDSNAATFGEVNDEFGFRPTVAQNSRSYTGGATSALTNDIVNDFRFNYTHNLAGSIFQPLSFGGGVAADLAAMDGVPANTPTYLTGIALEFGTYFAELIQGRVSSPLTQWETTDTLTWIHGRHQLKFGVDYRRIEPNVLGEGNPLITPYYFSEAGVLANAPGFTFLVVNKPVYPVFINNSLFAQDEWKVVPRLSLSLGLRWEVDPAPGNRNHTAPYVLESADTNNPTVAPYGTPLYHTSWYNFAPRLGAAYLLRTSTGWETVVRAGGGLFYDAGQATGGLGHGLGEPGYGTESLAPLPWPVTPSEWNIPVANPPVPPYGTFYSYPTHLQLPYSLEWNASIQQSLGSSQTVTLSYVGSHAARQQGFTEFSSLNPNFTTIAQVTSGFPSDYGSLQAQYQRKLTHGLQALGSYTFGHCIDYSSTDAGTFIIPERGNCDYDLRHNFSAAASYDVPNVSQNRFAKAIVSNWGLDDRFTARTGYPVQLYGNFLIDPATGQNLFGLLNVVPGEPHWLYSSNYPGGREVNPAAFTPPPPGVSGDFPRNSLTGFGAWQMDLAVRRTFPIYENLKLQFRAESFNMFNHPNFGMIYPYYCPAGPGCQFGQATQTLNTSLGGLSPLYQLGGPRSLQFALKLLF